MDTKFLLKKFLLAAVFCMFIFGIFGGVVSAAREFEVGYPKFPDFVFPTKVKDILPEYIKYIFNFAIFIAGFIALGMLIYAGVRWLTSAGNPSVISDAKSQMLAAFLGLVVLLSSYLILYTINPQLVLLLPSLKLEWGIVIYKDNGCPGDGDFREIAKNTPDLGDFNPNSFQFRAGRGLEVEFHNQPDYRDDSPQRFSTETATGCIDIAAGTKSILFRWKLPGVYLCSEPLPDSVCEGIEKFIQATTATLEDFDNKAKAVKMRNIDGVKYGAVLHEHQGFTGECSVFTDTDPNLNDNLIGGRTSSVTTFIQSDTPIGSGVTFYEHDSYGGISYGPFKGPMWVESVGDKGITNDSITSLKIDGNYIAILFDEGRGGKGPYEGTCQVFTERIYPNLRNDPIGRCYCGPFGWGCRDCLSSFIILPTK